MDPTTTTSGSPIRKPDTPILLDAASLIEPTWIKMSAWSGHIPFGAYLISTLQPKVFVELGTHYGMSFMAFCQAVVENHVPTKCFAVDTWTGDEHANFYGEEVFRELSSFQSMHYSDFSYLLRMTFDSALLKFEDSSVDLLHIDGFHSYEAVKHDFETWKPKLSKRGVVLFHDTQVRERDFGVWKLWSELTNEFPSFEFEHSHGLGVLFVGQEIQSEAIRLISKWNGESGGLDFKKIYELLGQRIPQQYELADLKNTNTKITAELNTLTRYAGELNTKIDKILSSASWKLTKPFRAVNRLIR